MMHQLSEEDSNKKAKQQEKQGFPGLAKDIWSTLGDQ